MWRQVRNSHNTGNCRNSCILNTYSPFEQYNNFYDKITQPATTKNLLMSDSIILEINQSVASITLNRPDRLNSFNVGMHQALHEALSQVENSEARVLLITGAGRGFCAGQDLSARNVASNAEVPDLGASLEKNYNPTIRAIRNLQMPVICAVNGVAAGAGANIALACDLVIAARSASFVQAFCKIGLVPDSGGTFFLPRLAGTARAMGLAMLGDRISADQARDWGLIWDVVDDENLTAESSKLAEHLASQPTRGLALIKRAIYASADNNLDQQLDLERDSQRLAGTTSDYREGVAAFMGKRQAKFTGQ
ncbi:MAG: 2-(1,2-epoxy-1,2-dihydrophenyl)acetyl-CoA isomerase [Gammaproteobacteria bacterium]